MGTFDGDVGGSGSSRRASKPHKPARRAEIRVRGEVRGGVGASAAAPRTSSSLSSSAFTAAGRQGRPRRERLPAARTYRSAKAPSVAPPLRGRKQRQHRASHASTASGGSGNRPAPSACAPVSRAPARHRRNRRNDRGEETEQTNRHVLQPAALDLAAIAASSRGAGRFEAAVEIRRRTRRDVATPHGARRRRRGVLPTSAREAVRERLARSRQRPSAASTSAASSSSSAASAAALLSLGVGGDAAPRASPRAPRPSPHLRASLLFALQSVALSRAELTEICVHLRRRRGPPSSPRRRRPRRRIHVDELIDVQVRGLRVLTLDRLRGAVGLDGHAGRGGASAWSSGAPLRAGVVHAGEVGIPALLARRGAARSITPTMSNSSKVRSTAASAATAEGTRAPPPPPSGLIPANRATSATVACFTPSQIRLIVFAAATRVSTACSSGTRGSEKCRGFGDTEGVSPVSATRATEAKTTRPQGSIGHPATNRRGRTLGASWKRLVRRRELADLTRRLVRRASSPSRAGEAACRACCPSVLVGLGRGRARTRAK